MNGVTPNMHQFKATALAAAIAAATLLAPSFAAAQSLDNSAAPPQLNGAPGAGNAQAPAGQPIPPGNAPQPPAAAGNANSPTAVPPAASGPAPANNQPANPPAAGSAAPFAVPPITPPAKAAQAPAPAKPQAVIDDRAYLPPAGPVHLVHNAAVEAVNHARLARHVAHHFSNAVLRAQILLDRAHFSPGEIDGHFDRNMAEALKGYQAAQGLPVTGRLDAATWKALTEHDPAPVLEAYTLVDSDLVGPFVHRIPARIDDQANLPCTCYTSPLEELGEKFHINPALLARFNRHKALHVGATIIAPMIHVNPPGSRAAKVVVTAHSKTVAVLDADGHILAQYPATIGSSHDPLPVGDWKIRGVAHHPKYHYNPVHFWDANPNDGKATVPPGPNNPVGAVWTQLSIPHYGIHGTPAPGMIGKSYSHGCIRLTNWDALEFSKMVRPGTEALLQQ